MTKPIGVALVGCGRISDLHIMGYRDRTDARVLAVCDTKPGRAKQRAKEWGVEKAYTNYEQVLADPDIQLVELLTPHDLHCPMTVQACQAGKHVSVQKPMSICASEADQMIAAAQKAGVVLRVYENFVYYAPAVKAKQMIEAGEIGEPQMIRLHVNNGTEKTSWKVPMEAWLWRINEKHCGGGPLIFDHGYHIFSVAYYLMGAVERVYGWIDRSQVYPGIHTDAPAAIMFQFKSPRRYGMFDVEYTPKMHIDSLYYADDDRIEIIGEKGIIFINRYTAKTIDLPELMLFKDGKTTPIPVEGVEWHDSFIAATHDMLDKLASGGQARLDGPTGKAVLQFSLAAHCSAREGREVRPDDMID